MLTMDTVAREAQKAAIRFAQTHDYEPSRCLIHPKALVGLTKEHDSRAPQIYHDRITGKQTITIAGMKVKVCARIADDRLEFE